ncbi:rhomboid family intramembrane serine protease [Pseudoteredinibacter isoporae]|uniref:Membrane associated rhomboid family serine protease n=1 Tax=Pseudoteredinibacter isoporae TaxID=570281 RepID=A0A7X0JV94_9GAMM|nr:rhomboid family intramembrane serine protease [Pseudoteredinibacter isoporae]MBB6522912.1 membrane associated rhomboid family serine protease [Pseudoteredinibacter isoporae]NHO88438.1 rhomboid family intramembrane serine protease [Pseudoteredinibacter isoporae]NIB23231.1 rhomboid family intramembrane serine protease [Pseudoteredinibacter isoporae]
MADKKCPRCPEEVLIQHRYERQELDLCRTCGGLWFDKDEVNAVIRAKNPDIELSCFKESFGQSLGESDIECPTCQLNMQRHHLLEHFHLEIDICLHCEGSWLDRGELPPVEQSPELESHLQELNKGLSWKTYFFQLLLQMPVEFNAKAKCIPWVNYSLLALNILIFLAYFFNDTSYNWVLNNFAMTPSVVAEGNQLWALMSCVFLHGSVWHLGANMYFLAIIGDNLEDTLGHISYLLLYLACGLLASLGTMIWRLGSDIPSIGASGAIAGLFAMYMIWFRHASLSFMFILYQKKLSVVWFFALWVGLNIFGLFFLDDGMDYPAHIAGFVAGLMFAFLLKDWIHRKNPLLSILRHESIQLKR